MNKLLNLMTMFYGLLLLVSGVLKCFGILHEFTLHFNDTYVIIKNPDFLLWIIGVNFIGGACMIIHALFTFNYKRKRKQDVLAGDVLEIAEEPAYGLQPLGCFAILTGIISVLVAFFMLIRAFIMLGLFENADGTFLPLILILGIYYIPFALIPGLLVVKNIFLSNDVGEKLKYEERLKRYREREDS